MCLKCTKDSTKCESCDVGFHPSKEDGQCRDCDQYEDQVRCLKCTEGTDGTATCNQCATGYLLNTKENNCDACEKSNCANCKDGISTCSKCSGGFMLDTTKKECVNCGVDLHHCKECVRDNINNK